mmetsp:Transcript_93205/g.243020  ORF Transcript_93205/g.243020 Transcript_93205/m.243020 type:complete len:200 (-) Transcript_93205:303-902(-)
MAMLARAPVSASPLWLSSKSTWKPCKQRPNATRPAPKLRSKARNTSRSKPGGGGGSSLCGATACAPAKPARHASPEAGPSEWTSWACAKAASRAASRGPGGRSRQSSRARPRSTATVRWETWRNPRTPMASSACPASCRVSRGASSRRAPSMCSSSRSGEAFSMPNETSSRSARNTEEGWASSSATPAQTASKSSASLT